MESYLWMILPGQISLDDEEETLKAQAVILRTDIIRRIGNGKKIKEENLPYERMSDEKLKEALGSKKYSIKDHARKQAVSETLGEVLIYDGKYIEPFFHGISVGKTISGKEWFGKEFPYLKAKDSVKDVGSKRLYDGFYYILWKDPGKNTIGTGYRYERSRFEIRFISQ